MRKERLRQNGEAWLMAASSVWESLTCANIFVVLASVSGFIERRCRSGRDYIYIVEVSWSDGRTTYVKRTYEDFLNFENSVISELKEESSGRRLSAKHVDIPRLKGMAYIHSINALFLTFHNHLYICGRS